MSVVWTRISETGTVLRNRRHVVPNWEATVRYLLAVLLLCPPSRMALLPHPAPRAAVLILIPVPGSRCRQWSSAVKADGATEASVLLELSLRVSVKG